MYVQHPNLHCYDLQQFANSTASLSLFAYRQYLWAQVFVYLLDWQ